MNEPLFFQPPGKPFPIQAFISDVITLESQNAEKDANGTLWGVAGEMTEEQLLNPKIVTLINARVRFMSQALPLAWLSENDRQRLLMHFRKIH